MTQSSFTRSSTSLELVLISYCDETKATTEARKRMPTLLQWKETRKERKGERKNKLRKKGTSK
jgi:hypothetical protein